MHYNSLLAKYFTSKPLYLDEPVQKKPNIRKLVEQPWQQTKGEMWDEVTKTLCHLDFIHAKAAGRMTFDLVNDFNVALELIPENNKTIQDERERQARMDKYVQDLIACAKGDINTEELEIPDSITPWTKGQIEAEIERIKTNPTNVDLLKDFLNFLGIESHNLQNYATEFAYFSQQQAWNYAVDGPVGKNDENTSKLFRKILLLRHESFRPPWNPLPQILKTMQVKSLVYSVAITPDGKKAICSTADNTCVVWDLTTGKKLQILKGHTDYVRAVSITPDGTKAVSGSQDNTIIFWNLTTGSVIHILEGHTHWVYTVSITPDGEKAISGSQDNTCILWDLKRGKILQILKGHSSYVLAVSITPDGRRAFSCSESTCIFWDLTTEEKILVLKGYWGNVPSVSITPDGKRAFTGCDDSTCILWDLTTGRQLLILQGHTGVVRGVSITPDCKRAISCSNDKTIILWDLTKGEALQTFIGHTNFINAVSITPDGKTALSGSRDETCILWDLTKGVNTQAIKGHDFYSQVSDISISHDGKRAISGASDKRFLLWDLIKGEQVSTLRMDDTITVFSITPDGKRVFSVSTNNSCILWDLISGKVVKIFKGHTDKVMAVIVTPNGKNAISGSFDKTCILWDLETGNAVHRLVGHIDRIWSISITPDGKRAISSSSDKKLIFWDLVTGKLLKAVQTSDGIMAIAITPDGKKVFTGSWGKGTCLLWDCATGEILKRYNGHSYVVFAVSISPDGNRAISVSADKHCILWDLSVGKKLAVSISSSEMRSAKMFNKGLVIGGFAGEVMILNIDQSLICQSIAICNVRQIFDFDFGRFTQPLADCALCGHRFEPPKATTQTILQILHDERIGAEQSPCLELLDEAWENPGLLGECPNCHEKLKFNPFFGSDVNGIVNYISSLERNSVFQEVLDKAEKSFKEEKWDDAYNLYFKLVQQGKFDINDLRFKMALCHINSLNAPNQEIIKSINMLVKLLQEKGESEKVIMINAKLKERIESLEQEERAKKKAGKPWWKR